MYTENKSMMVLTFKKKLINSNLDKKYIAPSKEGDEIIGFTKILKKTKTMVFLTCDLKCNDKIIANASGVWKIYKNK